MEKLLLMFFPEFLGKFFLKMGFHQPLFNGYVVICEDKNYKGIGYKLEISIMNVEFRNYPFSIYAFFQENEKEKAQFFCDIISNESNRNFKVRKVFVKM